MDLTGFALLAILQRADFPIFKYFAVSSRAIIHYFPDFVKSPRYEINKYLSCYTEYFFISRLFLLHLHSFPLALVGYTEANDKGGVLK